MHTSKHSVCRNAPKKGILRSSSRHSQQRLQVDLLLNLAPIEPDEFTALVRLVRNGGVVVSTTASMLAPYDADRGVRSVVVFVRSDTGKLGELGSLVDSGELTLEVTRSIPLTELQALHVEAAEGPISGKVIVIP